MNSTETATLNREEKATAARADAASGGGSAASSKSQSGLERDVQRLAEALAALADAAVQPVARTLTALGDGIAPRDNAGPQVSLRGVENSTTQLWSAALRLAENAANLALRVVTGTSPADGAVVAASPQGLPAVAAGGTLRMPMAIENPTREPMEDLSFHVAELRGPAGSSLSAAFVSVSPGSIRIAPGDFEKLTVRIDAPPDAEAGIYEGVLRLPNRSSFAVPFRFRVTR